MRAYFALVAAWIALFFYSPAFAGIQLRTVSLASVATLILIDGEFELKDDPVEFAKIVLSSMPRWSPSKATVETFTPRSNSALEHGPPCQAYGYRLRKQRPLQAQKILARWVKANMIGVSH